MGQVTQIAFELRNLTQEQMDEWSSDAEEEELTPKRRDMLKWMDFCKHKIDKIEKVWNRKLEDDRPASEEDEATEEAIDTDNQFSHEDFLDRVLSKGQQRAESRSEVGLGEQSRGFDSL